MKKLLISFILISLMCSKVFADNTFDSKIPTTKISDKVGQNSDKFGQVRINSEQIQTGIEKSIDIIVPIACYSTRNLGIEDKALHYTITKSLGDLVLLLPIKIIKKHPIIVRTTVAGVYFIVWDGFVEGVWLHNYGAFIADAGGVLTSVDYVGIYHKFYKVKNGN